MVSEGSDEYFDKQDWNSDEDSEQYSDGTNWYKTNKRKEPMNVSLRTKVAFRLSDLFRFVDIFFRKVLRTITRQATPKMQMMRLMMIVHQRIVPILIFPIMTATQTIMAQIKT